MAAPDEPAEVDVAALMEAIRKRIEEKKKGLYTDDEIREIAEHKLDAVLDAHDFNPTLVQDFRTSPARWKSASAASTGCSSTATRSRSRATGRRTPAACREAVGRTAPHGSDAAEGAGIVRTVAKALALRHLRTSPPRAVSRT